MSTFMRIMDQNKYIFKLFKDVSGRKMPKKI